MRAIITTGTVVALLATGAGTAAARPADMPPSHETGVQRASIGAGAMRGIHADGLRLQAEAAAYRHDRDVAFATRRSRGGVPRQDLRSPDARDAAAGRRTGHGPQVVVVRQHAQPVRVTRLADSGFGWADAGIGAGLATALLLSAAGASALRRQHPAAP
jgi:hypothetical protein